MQRHQRIRHRVMWLVLGPLAVIALIYAVTNRQSIPVMKELPTAEPKPVEDANR